MSYGTDQEFADWLDGQGLSLVGCDLTVLRQVGSAYVDAAYEYRLQCSRRAGGLSQADAWPRSGHKFAGEAIPDDTIPQAWVIASYRAAYLHGSSDGWAAATADPDRIVKRQKVDVIEREFFASGDVAGSAVAPGMPADAMINGLVLPLLCPTRRPGMLVV